MADVHRHIGVPIHLLSVLELVHSVLDRVELVKDTCIALVMPEASLKR